MMQTVPIHQPHAVLQTIRHYIAKEKKYGEWEAIDCSRTLIGKYAILFAICKMLKLTLTY